MAHRLGLPGTWDLRSQAKWDLSPLCWKVESCSWVTRKVPWCSFFLCSSAGASPRVNDIQSSSSTSQNIPDLRQAQPESGGLDRKPAALSRTGMGVSRDVAPRSQSRAPELCSLGDPALRTGQHMELELTTSTMAGLLGHGAKATLRTRCPSVVPDLVSQPFSQLEAALGDPGGGDGHSETLPQEQAPHHSGPRFRSPGVHEDRDAPGSYLHCGNICIWLVESLARSP